MFTTVVVIKVVLWTPLSTCVGTILKLVIVTVIVLGVDREIKKEVIVKSNLNDKSGTAKSQPHDLNQQSCGLLLCAVHKNRERLRMQHH